MKKIITTVFVACIGLSLAFGVHAQTYPSKPITLVVPTGPGGGFDLVARRLEKVLAKNLGQSVVVINRPGSGSLIGTMAVVNAAPDGYTLMMGGLSNIIFNGSMYKKRPYDPLADFTAIGIVAQTPYVMLARRDLTQGDITSVTRFALANPGKLNIGNAGAGTGQQVLGAAYVKETGAKLLSVPYQSAQAVYTDLLGGRVDLLIDTLPSARRFIESKQVNALFTTGNKRDPLFPNLPTARESGLPGSEMTSWFGLFALSKTPPDVLVKLHKALELSLKDEELRSQLEAGGFQPVAHVSAAATRKFVEAEYKKWTQVIRDAGITLD